MTSSPENMYNSASMNSQDPNDTQLSSSGLQSQQNHNANANSGSISSSSSVAMSTSRSKQPQLSEEERKLHHIQSEHKRRAQIRSTFDQLVDLVPELDATESRSELIVLLKSTDFINKLRSENEELIKVATEKGIEVPDSLK